MSDPKPFTDPNLRLSVALKYCRAGIWVTPASHPASFSKNAGKRKILTGWNTTQLDEAQVLEHFGKPSNLGIVLGRCSGFAALDIDDRNGGRPWYDDNKYRLGTPLEEVTGGGGLHLYYRYPDAVDRIPNRTLADGVELRGDGSPHSMRQALERKPARGLSEPGGSSLPCSRTSACGPSRQSARR